MGINTQNHYPGKGHHCKKGMSIGSRGPNLGRQAGTVCAEHKVAG